MTLVGLELNGTRAMAVSGVEGMAPRPLVLDLPHSDLPMAISLENRRPELGRPGTALVKKMPHLLCQDFLVQLGEEHKWVAGRHRLDSVKAVTLLLDHLKKPLGEVEAIGLSVPAYLTTTQLAILCKLIEKAKLPLAGWLYEPLALAMHAHASQPWTGLGLVVDVDDHALTCTALQASRDEALLIGDRPLPRLNQKAWKDRLLDAIADRCVRHSRRDPRDSAISEQMLFEQMDRVMDDCRKGQMTELVIESPHWYQNMFLGPEEITSFCAGLARQVGESLRALLGSLAPHDAPAVIILSQAANQLPGLAGVVLETADVHLAPIILPPDGAARGAFLMASHISAGDMSRGANETKIPLFTRNQKLETRTQKVPGPILFSGY